MTTDLNQTQPEPEALLPDGIGLDLKTVIALLSEKHGMAVPKNDPILMVVTIQNAYLAEVEKLHNRHSKGLSKLLADKADGYVAAVKEATEALEKEISAANVEALRKLSVENAEQMKALQNNTFWAAAIVAVSALVNVAVFVVKAVAR